MFALPNVRHSIAVGVWCDCRNRQARHEVVRVISVQNTGVLCDIAHSPLRYDVSRMRPHSSDQSLEVFSARRCHNRNPTRRLCGKVEAIVDPMVCTSTDLVSTTPWVVYVPR